MHTLCVDTIFVDPTDFSSCNMKICGVVLWAHAEVKPQTWKMQHETYECRVILGAETWNWDLRLNVFYQSHIPVTENSSYFGLVLVL